MSSNKSTSNSFDTIELSQGVVRTNIISNAPGRYLKARKADENWLIGKKISDCQQCLDLSPADKFSLHYISMAFKKNGCLTARENSELGDMNRKAYAIRMSRLKCKRFS